jgi:hypothetical protein
MAQSQDRRVDEEAETLLNEHVRIAQRTGKFYQFWTAPNPLVEESRGGQEFETPPQTRQSGNIIAIGS